MTNPRRYRTEASARRILRQRWKTALRHHRIPQSAPFRTAVFDLSVDPKNTRMTRALFLVNGDGHPFPNLPGGVPFTPPRRKRRKPTASPSAELEMNTCGKCPIAAQVEDEGSPIGAPPPSSDPFRGPTVPILWTPGQEGTLPADMPRVAEPAADNPPPQSGDCNNKI